MRFLLFYLFPCYLRALSALYLTWYEDPSTTMAIQWHTPKEQTGDLLYVRSEGEEWRSVEGSHKFLQDRCIHAVFLRQLQPGGRYEFRIASESTVYQFETAPQELTEPIRFIVGGDAMESIATFHKMNRMIRSQNPLFCVIGGDIAYAIHPDPLQIRLSPIDRWFAFLSIWKQQMVASDGRIIPFLLAVGNHDITLKDPDLFFTLFAFPERHLYRSLDFGRYLSLILLDTNHFEKIGGAQTVWLEEALRERTDVVFRFPVYHVAAYPSFYAFQSTIPKEIRSHWCPLFEKYGVRVAFENHNHTYKKSWPLKQGKIDNNGIIYLGDGSWGVTPRKADTRWYLQKSVGKNSVYLVVLSPEVARMQALDIEGKAFDEIEFFTQTPWILPQMPASHR